MTQAKSTLSALPLDIKVCHDTKCYQRHSCLRFLCRFLDPPRVFRESVDSYNMADGTVCGFIIPVSRD
jgi:hypothetical protein